MQQKKTLNPLTFNTKIALLNFKRSSICKYLIQISIRVILVFSVKVIRLFRNKIETFKNSKNAKIFVSLHIK